MITVSYNKEPFTKAQFDKLIGQPIEELGDEVHGLRRAGIDQELDTETVTDEFKAVELGFEIELERFPKDDLSPIARSLLEGLKRILGQLVTLSGTINDQYAATDEVMSLLERYTTVLLTYQDLEFGLELTY